MAWRDRTKSSGPAEEHKHYWQYLEYRAPKDTPYGTWAVRNEFNQIVTYDIKVVAEMNNHK